MTKKMDMHDLCFNRFDRKFVKLNGKYDLGDFAFDLFVENKKLREKIKEIEWMNESPNDNFQS